MLVTYDFLRASEATQLGFEELISARSGPGMTNKSVNFVAVNKAIDMLNYICLRK